MAEEKINSTDIFTTYISFLEDIDHIASTLPMSFHEHYFLKKELLADLADLPFATEYIPAMLKSKITDFMLMDANSIPFLRSQLIDPVIIAVPEYILEIEQQIATVEQNIQDNQEFIRNFTYFPNSSIQPTEGDIHEIIVQNVSGVFSSRIKKWLEKRAKILVPIIKTKDYNALLAYHKRYGIGVNLGMYLLDQFNDKKAIEFFVSNNILTLKLIVTESKKKRLKKSAGRSHAENPVLVDKALQQISLRSDWRGQGVDENLMKKIQEFTFRRKSGKKSSPKRSGKKNSPKRSTRKRQALKKKSR